MKVLDLQCAHHHRFEGWFASEDDFQVQLARRLVACPVCADTEVTKMPSAPRLNLGAGADPVRAPSQASSNEATLVSRIEPARATAMPDAGAATQDMQVTQAEFLSALRKVVAGTEDVGERFAEEARRMHYGESEERAIRGQASVRETVDLLEEGIEVMPLSMLPALKQTLQ